MPVINLKLKKRIDNSYKIFVQKGISNDLHKHLKEMKIGKKYAIITDSTVRKLFGNALLRKLKRKGIKGDIFSFTKGEKSKRLETVEKLAEEMIKKGFDKNDAIIALGGGVVGDMAGLLAAIYMRGIPYIQVPTTLMAMVDSSIGGKTSVDMVSGKNLLGTITQPKAVFMDLDYLKNLPEKQVKNGLAEVIKYGVIWDKGLFKFIERNVEKIINRDEKALEKVVKKSVRAKVKVVHFDEQEKGIRIILNYGHTYGHALEKLSGYKLLHGYAISIGMVIANKIAVKKGFLKPKVAERIKNLLNNAGLPVTTVKVPSKKDISTDKKKVGKYIKFILPTKLGKVIVHREKCL